MWRNYGFIAVTEDDLRLSHVAAVSIQRVSRTVRTGLGRIDVTICPRKKLLFSVRYIVFYYFRTLRTDKIDISLCTENNNPSQKLIYKFSYYFLFSVENLLVEASKVAEASEKIGGIAAASHLRT